MQHYRVAKRVALGFLLGAIWGCADAGESPRMICDGLAARAGETREAAQAAADRACSADADCAIAITSISCRDGCGAIAAVNQGAKNSLEARVRAIDADLCGEFRERDCPHGTKCAPPPAPLPVAFCRAARCVIEYLPPE